VPKESRAEIFASVFPSMEDYVMKVVPLSNTKNLAGCLFQEQTVTVNTLTADKTFFNE